MKARCLSTNSATNSQALSTNNPSAHIYLDALLWLTPTNPFSRTKVTTIDFSFGAGGCYTLYDPESTVDLLKAGDWNSAVGPAGSVALPNGDVISVPYGWTGEQAATYVALTTAQDSTRLQSIISARPSAWGEPVAICSFSVR